MSSKQDCNLCSHKRVCQLWRENECQDAGTLSSGDDGCDYFTKEQRWISVSDELPPVRKDGNFNEYLVIVQRSHFPTSSYDLCDVPYSETFVTAACFDSVQKIWHIIGWNEDLNALIPIEDSPLNGDYITHWMELPEPAKECT